MPTRMAKTLVLVLLTGVIGQVGFLGWSAISQGADSRRLSTAPYARLAVGDTLNDLQGVLNNVGVDSVVSLEAGDGRWMLIFAFHSECAWCAAVAPTWSAWLPSPPGIRSLAVTRDDPVTAVRYARRHEWAVDVLSVMPGDPERSEGFIVSRTPWLFLFDDAGVLRYHGHGSDLARPMSMIASEVADVPIEKDH